MRNNNRALLAILHTFQALLQAFQTHWCANGHLEGILVLTGVIDHFSISQLKHELKRKCIAFLGYVARTRLGDDMAQTVGC